MKATLIKTAAFITIIVLALGVNKAIQATAKEQEEKAPVDSRPLVSAQAMQAINHDVIISSFGEVQPLEQTVLAAQVSGEVISWHPNFVQGGVVKRGDVLFSIEKDAYEAAVLQAQAQVSLADATLTEELARQQVAKREAKNLPNSSVSDLYLRKPQVLSAQAQLKSAQANLRIAERNLAKTEVTAPYDALVMNRDIGTGQYVSAGMQVATLSNIENAEVIVPIAGFDRPFLLDQIQGNEAIVSTKDRAPVQRSGLVSRDLGVLDQDTRMLHLVIRIEDPYSLNSDAPPIKFGSYVEVSFKGQQLKGVFKVPQSLVNNRKIWLLDENDTLRSQSVEVIREEGSYFLISSGLGADDIMVKDLPEYPQNGMQVKVKTPEQALISYVRR
ncbi:efflux RND transporter periplasmic adaptor subunit [Glaciecola sp. XM2]|uniref:efflux RND transporter periplasmic adaptor subunit n=1 Tax=Glaciecola sp. XM2 TaxID=1914931 RepID=UPI001BDDEF03|nr:efflux RND transporter periplasmic adaptor subunit [Glaciecola sp. XM2]MBT1450118.1 efflux RND transporter periplasmic adaptor subunit [Glaciecola sp. XM2]